MSLSISTTIGDVTGAGTVSIGLTGYVDVVYVGDAHGALTVTVYVVKGEGGDCCLLVGFVRVVIVIVVVDFFEFLIFVVVGLVDPRGGRKRPRRGGIRNRVWTARASSSLSLI